MRFALSVLASVCVLGLAGTHLHDGMKLSIHHSAASTLSRSGESKHGLLYARLTERGIAEAGVAPRNQNAPRSASRAWYRGGTGVVPTGDAAVYHHGGGRQAGADRLLAHFGHPGSWFSRHAADADKARILRLRIAHAENVARFFNSHPRLARTLKGRQIAWQHRRMGRWARRELRKVLWSPPLLAGEREWHATMKNPVNRNLWRLAVCETGGINGGRPLWTHRNSVYEGALGFAVSTWAQFRHEVRPLPPRHAYEASAGQQLAVGRALVRRFGGYSSWPSCHVRLGIY